MAIFFIFLTFCIRSHWDFFFVFAIIYNLHKGLIVNRWKTSWYYSLDLTVCLFALKDELRPEYEEALQEKKAKIKAKSKKKVFHERFFFIYLLFGFESYFIFSSCVLAEQSWRGCRWGNGPDADLPGITSFL